MPVVVDFVIDTSERAELILETDTGSSLALWDKGYFHCSPHLLFQHI